MLKNKWLKLDIQYFADGGDSGSESDQGDGNDTPPEDITLTQKELDKKIESEADRKLESAKQKWEKDQETKTQQLIKDALEEKERLSKLSEKERQDEDLTQREKDIAARLADLEQKELKADAVADLTTKELPASFADFLLGEDAEKTLSNINNFKTAFDEAVAQKVKESLRQETPGKGGGKPPTSIGSNFAKALNEQAKPIENTIWN